jgi:hypothetical protein
MKYMTRWVPIGAMAWAMIMAVLVAGSGPTMATEPYPSKVLDNSGTNCWSQNEAGPQVLSLSSLASPVSFDAEGMGFEPTCNSAANVDVPCACEKCHQASAAMALHCESSICLSLASIDASLQQVIVAWDGLPDAIRRAVMALIESQET